MVEPEGREALALTVGNIRFVRCREKQINGSAQGAELNSIEGSDYVPERAPIGIGRSLAAPPSHTTGRTGHVSGGSMN